MLFWFLFLCCNIYIYIKREREDMCIQGMTHEISFLIVFALVRAIFFFFLSIVT